jgi:hypothetical protein
MIRVIKIKVIGSEADVNSLTDIISTHAEEWDGQYDCLVDFDIEEEEDEDY